VFLPLNQYLLKIYLCDLMIQVAVGIIERAGRVLVCQRKKGARYELKWEFPGGKVENGEDPKSALERELLEELNITAEVGGEIHRERWVYPDQGEFDIRFFSVEKFTGDLQNLMFADISWVSLEDLKKFDLLEGSKEAARRISRRVKTQR
jgi:8-oxo-dGTP diphosphatase